jgi:hypothetical protein
MFLRPLSLRKDVTCVPVFAYILEGTFSQVGRVVFGKTEGRV